jgi:hypothetical protein
MVASVADLGPSDGVELATAIAGRTIGRSLELIFWSCGGDLTAFNNSPSVKGPRCLYLQQIEWQRKFKTQWLKKANYDYAQEAKLISEIEKTALWRSLTWLRLLGYRISEVERVSLAWGLLWTRSVAA